ncbi:MAG: hypothetical protein GEV04_08820 [Actinophytocola sp.]|nr:hypothetical protein [Actinophytocola sp.]
MAENWEATADAVNRAVTGAMASLEDVFEKERTVYGGSTWLEDLTSSVGIGKGFRFPSVEDANKIINNFKDRRDSIEKRRYEIQVATEALISAPFSTDSVSVSYLRAAKEALAKLEELNNSALKYTTSYIDKLEAAKRVKADSEEETAAGFDKTAEAS